MWLVGFELMLVLGVEFGADLVPILGVLVWFGLVLQEREVEVEEVRRPKLRYLEFVQVAAAQATICLAGLYALAKDHAGPLRPGVDAVESAVKGVVGPVYGRFHGVPLDVLAFVDRKVAPAPSFAVANGCRLGVVPRDERAVARLARSLAGRGGRACGGAR